MIDIREHGGIFSGIKKTGSIPFFKAGSLHPPLDRLNSYSVNEFTIWSTGIFEREDKVTTTSPRMVRIGNYDTSYKDYRGKVSKAYSEVSISIKGYNDKFLFIYNGARGEILDRETLENITINGNTSTPYFITERSFENVYFIEDELYVIDSSSNIIKYTYDGKEFIEVSRVKLELKYYGNTWAYPSFFDKERNLFFYKIEPVVMDGKTYKHVGADIFTGKAKVFSEETYSMNFNNTIIFGNNYLTIDTGVLRILDKSNLKEIKRISYPNRGSETVRAIDDVWVLTGHIQLINTKTGEEIKAPSSTQTFIGSMWSEEEKAFLAYKKDDAMYLARTLFEDKESKK